MFARHGGLCEHCIQVMNVMTVHGRQEMMSRSVAERKDSKG
jgi:hypothetical protein